MMEILTTYRHGAGWSTWNNDTGGLPQYLATYQPLIDRVKEREKEMEDLTFTERYYGDVVSKDDPVIRQLEQDIKVKFGFSTKYYLGGCINLTIEEIYGPVLIKCRDGLEYVEAILIPEGVIITP
jgi:hypothetical protein